MKNAAKKANLNNNSNFFQISGDLKQRILFTFFALIIYRIGSFVPLPGIDAYALSELVKSSYGGILGMFNMLSGGSLERMTIFALAIMPYITASIIMQLISVISKNVEMMKKEGEVGRKKINQYTRFLTVILASIQGFGIAVGLENVTTGVGNVVIEPGVFFRMTTIITLTGGTVFLMWLGEQITARGIGNGTSLIIFTGIICGLPRAITSLFELARTGALSIIMSIFICAAAIGLIWLIIFVERAQRKINVQYAKRQVGNKIYGGENTHLPLKLNTAGVIPPIFASSILLFPLTIANFTSNIQNTFLENMAIYLGHGRPLYILLYALLIIFFAFFYTSVVFNSEETAENFKKNGAIILGKRPGKVTAEYLDFVLTRITVIGAIYMCFVCILPEFIIGKYNIPFYLGGTSMLIVVNVVTDTMTQIQSHLFASQYKGLMKKINLSGRKT